MAAVAYCLFFRPGAEQDSGRFSALGRDEADAERGSSDASPQPSASAGSGPFASLAGREGRRAAASPAPGEPSLSELDAEQAYSIALLRHSDTSPSGAVQLTEEVLTRLGIPSYGQASFTAKLKDSYLSSIQQLQQLDSSDWKRLNFPLVIEEAIRKGLDDRRRLLEEAEAGGGRAARRPAAAAAVWRSRARQPARRRTRAAASRTARTRTRRAAPSSPRASRSSARAAEQQRRATERRRDGWTWMTSELSSEATQHDTLTH